MKIVKSKKHKSVILIFFTAAIVSCSSGGGGTNSNSMGQLSFSSIGSFDIPRHEKIAYTTITSFSPYRKLVVSMEPSEESVAVYYTNNSSTFERRQLLIPESYVGAQVWGSIIPDNSDLYLPVRQQSVANNVRVILLKYSFNGAFIGELADFSEPLAEELEKIEISTVEGRTLYFLRKNSHSAPVLCSIELDKDPLQQPVCDYGITLAEDYNKSILVRSVSDQRFLYSLRREGIYRQPILSRQRGHQKNTLKNNPEGTVVMSADEATRLAKANGGDVDFSIEKGTSFYVGSDDNNLTLVNYNPATGEAYIAREYNKDSGRISLSTIKNLPKDLTDNDDAAVVGAINADKDPLTNNENAVINATGINSLDRAEYGELKAEEDREDRHDSLIYGDGGSF